MRYFFILLVFIVLQSCRQEDKDAQSVDEDTGIQNIFREKDEAIKDSIRNNWYVALIEIIDSTKFYQKKEIAKPALEEYTSITDIKEVNLLLKDRVIFGDYNEDELLKTSDSGYTVMKIKPYKGEVITFNKYNEPGFLAYYPELDILLCEVGHQLEVSYNLTTGETTKNTGNPGEYVTSENGVMRLNGSYDGQECYGYFIQVKKDGRYQRIIPLQETFRDRMSSTPGICQISEAFWIGNEELYIRENNVFPNKYYRVKLGWQ